MDTITKISLGATRGLVPLIRVDEYTTFHPRHGLLRGVAAAVTDVVATPIRSAREHGMSQLPGGAFAGLIGLVLKPLGGQSKTFENRRFL